MTRACLLITVVVLAASPALAFDANKLGQGGSLPLSDLDPLLAQSAPLKGEVATALTAAKKKADDVICSGNRPRTNGSIWAARGLHPTPAIFPANG
jgi:hypothetical protein